ncbi:protein of unknown function [Pseudomonas sp. JV551A1]|nr:protein of unknown function [Pseudomonas sp. JV551A1]
MIMLLSSNLPNPVASQCYHREEYVFIDLHKLKEEILRVTLVLERQVITYRRAVVEGEPYD